VATAAGISSEMIRDHDRALRRAAVQRHPQRIAADSTIAASTMNRAATPLNRVRASSGLSMSAGAVVFGHALFAWTPIAATRKSAVDVDALVSQNSRSRILS